MTNFIVFFLTFILSHQLFATIRILTFHYNQPDFVEIQYKTLAKFLKDDFELIVFNDAKTEEYEKLIEQTCNKYQIKHVRFEQEWHRTDPLNTYIKKRLEEPTTIGTWGYDASTSLEEIQNNPSIRHNHVIQYALDHFGYDHDDIVVVMDADNFLIKPLSIRELLGSNDIIGFDRWPDNLAEKRCRSQLAVPKGHEIFWVVFIAFNPRKLPCVRELHFHTDVVTGNQLLPENTLSDSGAAIYQYLWKHPDLQLQTYPWQSSYTYRCFSDEKLSELGISVPAKQFIRAISPDNVQFFVFEHFIHFSAHTWKGGNHELKVNYFHQFIEDILKEKL